MPVTSISLRGYIVGPIWWPAGAECYKPLSYSISDERCRWSEPGTLRDHVVAAVNDGDFQSATLAHAEIVIERRNGNRRVIRSFPLSHFPSITDCLHPDGEDWCPQGDWEDDDA